MRMQAAPQQALPQPGAAALLLSGSRPDGVRLRPLSGRDAAAPILHLRREIDLSVHAAAGPHFDMLEKKETKSAASSLSRSTVNRWAPSASSRSAGS
jgi:hypothetical protein